MPAEAYEAWAMDGPSEDDELAPAEPEPPYCNTGVRIPGPGGSEAPDEAQAEEIARENADDEVQAKFDWYGASVLTRGPLSDRGHPLDSHVTAAEVMAAYVADHGGQWEVAKPRQGFEQAMTHHRLVRSTETGREDLKPSGVTILWQAHNNPHPFIQQTSAGSHEFALWLRRRFAGHKVARADVAVDFTEDEAPLCVDLDPDHDDPTERAPRLFDRIVAIIEAKARARNCRCHFVGDPAENNPAFPEDKRKGRTWYFGSRKSAVMLRVYEKGLEQRGKGAVDADPNLVRVEVEVKPNKERKVKAALMDPFDLIGFSTWIAKAVAELVDEFPAITPVEKRDELPVKHALEYMAFQYRKHIRAMVEAEGWQDLNLFLYQLVYDHDERMAMEQRRREDIRAEERPDDRAYLPLHRPDMAQGWAQLTAHSRRRVRQLEDEVAMLRKALKARPFAA